MPLMAITCPYSGNIDVPKGTVVQVDNMQCLHNGSSSFVFYSDVTISASNKGVKFLPSATTCFGAPVTIYIKTYDAGVTVVGFDHKIGG